MWRTVITVTRPLPHVARHIVQSVAVRGIATHRRTAHYHINDREAADIAKALKTNTTLVSLKLAQNYITDEGALALADMLSRAIPSSEIRVPNFVAPFARNRSASGYTTALSLEEWPKNTSYWKSSSMGCRAWT